VQKLFSEAKELRSKHLRGLGTQSYGGWIKRQLVESQVHVLGGGQLVEEILPYLQKTAEKVTLHVRQPVKVAHLKVEVKALQDQAFDGGALIIAAPVKAEEIEQWLRKSPAQVFDLRDDSHVDRIANAPKHHVLQDIFHEIEHTRARLQPVIVELKAEILARAEKVANQVHVRPQGWDDICA
jgi:thioredoxin reductase